MELELFAEGEIKVSMINADIAITYAGKGGSVMVKVEGEYLLDKIAEAIPGTIDDTVISILKAALKG
jgi:hypothetical protein